MTAARLLARRAGGAGRGARRESSSTTTAAPLGVRGLRYRIDRLCRRGRPARRRLAAHPAPLVRDPPARWRRGPARGPGAARSREPGHDPGLHARLAGAPARPLPRRPSARDRSRRRRRRRDRDRRPWRRAGPRSSSRRVPRLARAGLGPRWSSSATRSGRARARRVLRRVPDPGPHLPARRRRSPRVGAHPVLSGLLATDERRAPGGSSPRSPT